VAINDSVAIMRHLERRTPEPPLFPADPRRRAEVDLFIEWFEQVYKHAPNAIEDELEGAAPDEALIEAQAERMRAHVALFEGMLDGRDYLFGDFGAADCVAYPFLKYAAGRDPADDELFHVILERHQPLGDAHPNLSAWIDRVSERPRAY
jgi:glutathione S-transferase